MREHIVRIRIRSRDPEQRLDEIRQLLESAREQTISAPVPPPADERECVLPDEQLETKLLPEMQKFLDDLDANAEKEPTFSNPRSTRNRTAEAAEAAALKLIVLLAEGGFVAVVLRLIGL